VDISEILVCRCRPEGAETDPTTPNVGQLTAVMEKIGGGEVLRRYSVLVRVQLDTSTVVRTG